MAQYSRDATWTDQETSSEELLRKTIAFLAEQRMTLQLRDGGTLIAKQGLAIGGWPVLVWLAPGRLLPKRSRIRVIQRTDDVAIEALIEDELSVKWLSLFARRRYERYFLEWLQQLRQCLSPTLSANSSITGAPLPAAAPDEQKVIADELGVPAEAGFEPLEGSAGLASRDGEQIAQGNVLPSLPVIPERVAFGHQESRPEQIVDSEEPPAPVEASPEPLESPSNLTPEKAGQMSRRNVRGSALLRLRRRLLGRQEPRPEVIKDLPESTQGEIMEGDRLFQMAAWEAALPQYSAAISSLQEGAPSAASALGATARVFCKRAVTYLRQSQAKLGVSPGDLLDSYHWSDIDVAIQLTRQAIEDYSEAIRLDPHSGSIHASRGSAYMQLAFYRRANRSFRDAASDLESAEGDFTTALRLDPLLAPAYANRAVALECIGRYDEAAADTATALTLGVDARELETARREAHDRSELRVPRTFDVV